MSLPATAPDLLKACLQTELNEISAFIVLLQREADMLADGAENDALTMVTIEKAQVAEQLQYSAVQRNTLLTGLGLGIDRQGLDAAGSVYPDIQPLIHNLYEQTAQARNLNNNNGEIITRFIRHNQKALDMLHQLTGQSNLYDALGRTQTARHHATHIKAG